MRRIHIALAYLSVVGFVGLAEADLENQVFISKPDELRVVIPRNWRATDQPSYPGLLLWLMRDQPAGRIALTIEPFTHSLFCSWPVECQASHDSNAARYACAIRKQLAKQSFRVGPTQIGPKENEAAGLPSVWFEYDDGSHFLRQAVAMDQNRAVSLILSAPSSDTRASHIRAFEQTLRTLRPLTTEELAVGSGGSTGSAGAAPTGSAAPPIDSSVNPVGACK